MTRKEICRILDCSNSYVTSVLSGKHESSLAKRIRKLINLEFDLQEIFVDTYFDAICEIVIKKSTQKQFAITAHAINCQRVRKMLLQKIAEEKKVNGRAELSNTDELILILQEGKNVLEKHFLDDKFVQMCEVVLAKCRDINLKKYAGDQMYLSLQLKNNSA